MLVFSLKVLTKWGGIFKSINCDFFHAYDQTDMSSKSCENKCLMVKKSSNGEISKVLST